MNSRAKASVFGDADPEPRIAAAASALRGHPELIAQLNWHLAAVATYRQNFGVVDQTATDLLRLLDRN